MSNLLEHAKHEMQTAGWFEDGDPEQQFAVDRVLELIKVFGDQGHSEESAFYVLRVFNHLARFRPLAPLTGADDEWIEVAEGIYQNKRFSQVFKEGGKAYWACGRVFRDKNGVDCINTKSRVPITFPWTYPEEGPEIVQRDSDGD